MLRSALGLALSAIAFATIGCGASDSSIPTTPLSGTIEGKTFEMKSAFALVGMTPSERFVVIRDADASCDDGSGTKDGELLVTAEIPWKKGATEAVDGAHPVTLAHVPDSVIATAGEVDVLAAPTDLGAVGGFLLRADAGDGQTKVEGEVKVTNCE
ncbi:MAG TPA: hypothetical protein VHB21_22160 [Minicystis sp.]|nr:hypothetical protein [Minicystis sp.]